MADCHSPTGHRSQSSTSRPYRSKKQRPCDGCRRRRVGCIVDQGQTDCSLCRHRGVNCTFEADPPVKKSRKHRLQAETSATRQGSKSGVTPQQHHDYGLVPGRTALYTGSSSDLDCHLLRHLPFNQSNTFGHDNWLVSRKSLPNDTAVSAYFTSYPDDLLDARDDIYDVGRVESIVPAAYHAALLDLYYQNVHTVLPILEPRPDFEAALASGAVPASLLAAVFGAAVKFHSLHAELRGSADPEWKKMLHRFVFEAITLETRTPTLRTIQTLLVHLQSPPSRVREPNHPGFWALTCQAVALAQEVGLHLDCEGWEISTHERRIRRVLWWAVYMQDKWLAHWLGRPSHITDHQFNVKPLRIDDFGLGDTNTTPDKAFSHSVEAFVSLSSLTVVLSNVLDTLYNIRRPSSSMAAQDALREAHQCQARLRDWVARDGAMMRRPDKVINDYALIFAYYGVAVSIQRALFACVGGTSYYDFHRESLLFSKLFDVFEDLLRQELKGLWLSYCKSNIAIFGTFIVTVLVSSTDDESYRLRKDILNKYRQLLGLMDGRFEFAALPRLRLDLLLTRFSAHSP